MSTTSKHTLDMTRGNALKVIILFALPTIGSNLLQSLFNAVDIMVVGLFSNVPNAVGAIGCTGSTVSLLINLFMGVSLGATVVIARYFGAQKYDDMNKAIHTSMCLSLILGVGIAVLGQIVAEPILRLINTPTEMLDLALTYLRIYLAGIVFNSIYNFGAAALKAVGDTRRPLLYLLMAGILNVVLNIFFVTVCSLSVEGVAIATVISQLFSAVCVVVCLMRETGALRFDLTKLSIDTHIARRVLYIGVPNGLQASLFSVSNIYIQSAINSLGAVVVNGSTAAGSLEGFTYSTMVAFQHTGLTYISQNIGAGDYSRARRGYYLLPLCALISGVVMSSVIYLLHGPLLSLYLSDVAEISSAMDRLTVMCAMHFLCGVMDSISGILRGASYSIYPAVVNLIGVVGLRILWVELLFPLEQFHSIQGIMASYPVTWVIVIVSLLTYLFAYANRGIERQCRQAIEERETLANYQE